MLETQGAISHSRAKTKVPMAATKRTLCRLGCFDLTSVKPGWVSAAGAEAGRIEAGLVKAGWVKVDSIHSGWLKGLAAVTGRSASTALTTVGWST